MPWRRRPRAAVIWLLGPLVLIAAAAGLRVASTYSVTPPELSIAARHTSASAASINATLMRDEEGCAGVRSTVWHPLSGIEYTGRLRITLPAQIGGAMMLYVGDSLPLDIEAATFHGDHIAIAQRRLTSGPGVHVPPDFWLDDGSPADAPAHITEVTIEAQATHDRLVTLALGRRAPRVVARLTGYPSSVRAAVCADAVREGEIYFATGWYGEERLAQTGTTIRWMRQHGAMLLASASGNSTNIRASLSAPDDDDGEGTEVTLRVNDVYEFAPVRVRAGFRDYEWLVPDAAWVAGTNELLFSVTRTRADGPLVRGLALASLHVD